MKWVRALGMLAAVFVVVSAQPPADDPVMKARVERAQAQGISEGDLPPVPRAIIEPPPLPPPELHARDLRRSGKGATVGRKAPRKGTKASRASKATRDTKVQSSQTKQPKGKAKVAPKRRKRKH